MDVQQAQAIFSEAFLATEPSKLAGLSLEQLESYYNSFHQARAVLGTHIERYCIERQELLRREIELRRIEQRAERHHSQAMELGGQTLGVGRQGLNWARIAGIAGIAAVLIGAASLFVQIYFSKNLPSPTVATSPKSSPQTTATRTASPELAAGSNNATPSPKPVATETPSGSP